MAYTRVQDRTKSDNPFFSGSFSFPKEKATLPVLTTPTSTALSTPAVKYIPVQQRFGLGEDRDSKLIPKTATTAPFGSIEAIEQKRQAEIFGQEITGVTTVRGSKPGTTPLGRTVTGGYTPVGVRVKLPFLQAGITLPDDAIGHMTKDLIQNPEKLFKSAYYQGLTPAKQEQMKIKDETKIFQSPLYQKDYKTCIDSGGSAIGCFVLTGIDAAVDASIFADLVASPIIKRLAKISVTKAITAKLTWTDLREITRGKILSNNKMAAFNKLSREGVDWTKTLKKSGNKLEVKVQKGKTLGQWIKEQNLQPGLSIKNIQRQELERTFEKFQKRKVNLIEQGGGKVAIRILTDSINDISKQLLELREPITKTTITNEIVKSKAGGDSFDEFLKTRGEPLYHGTNAKFEVFDKGKIGTATDEGLFGTGFYFGNTRAFAEIAPKGKFAENVIEVYPTSNNFFEINKIKSVKEMARELNMSEGALIKDTNGIIRPVRGQSGQFTSHVQALGYDGVVVKRGGDAIETVIFEPDIIITKPQLKQLWDKSEALGLATGIEEDEDGGIKFSPAGALAGVVGAKVVKRGSKAKKLSKEVYKSNRTLKRSIKAVISVDAKTILKGIGLGTDKYLGSVSTRLANINPDLKRELRKFEFKIRDNTLKDIKKIKPFLDSTKKMSKDDKLDFDLARKNGDKEKIDEIVKKYGIGKEYQLVRNTLDDLYDRAKAVGYNIGYLENYNPRVINDSKGFLNYFQKGDDWPILQKAINAKEQALQRYLTEEEKAQLINTMVRGYQQNSITLSETGNMKTREIDIVDAELNQFYMDANASLVKYLQQANEAIESRKFFGKGKIKDDIDINDSIGAYILRLLESGKITPTQEIIVSDILKARFNEVGTRGVIGLYKNLSYIDTMGSITSAVTQIGDLAWSIYKGGYTRTAKNTIKSIFGKSTIKRADIGIENIAQEFEDPTKASKAVNLVFKAIGLEKIDAVGKEALINTVIDVYKKKAKKNPDKLKKEIISTMGSETDQVIADLKAGDMTENVKLLAFNELLDFQPVALSEMPQKYLTGGNGRIFYMLKTFTLKQFDIYRREIFQQLAHKGTRLKGLTNMIRLISAFIIMNATADEIKDFILGRKTSLEDRVVDNILRAVGFSKYLTWKARTEGFGSAVARQILPPFKFIDSVSKDILKGIENGSEITQSVPLGGKLYYWWLGKGAYKNEKRTKSNEINRLDHIEERIKGIQSKTKLKDFEDRIKQIQNDNN